MNGEDAAASVRRISEMAAFSIVYVVLGTLSLSTAYVQANTAAVWLPSGFAVGLLLVRGTRYWPSVLIGSLVLNTIVNTSAPGEHEAFSSLLPAVFIAIGNTAEALVGAFLTNRYANGAAFFLRLKSLFRFLTLAVPVSPLFSAIIGVSASRISTLEAHGTFFDVASTWYIANMAGVLVFTGLTVLLLQSETGVARRTAPARALEAVVLAAAILFGTQAICGVFLSEWMAGWPKSYMLFPLVIWASFRFGAAGGMLAVAFITMAATLGTMKGFMAFPAETPWRALIYLQIFLAISAIVALTVSAAVAEVEAGLSELEHRVAARTRAIEHLLEQRDVVTALIVHDLKGPIYGVRNALKAVRSGIATNSLSPDDLASVIDVSEQTCTTVADRATGLLSAALGAQASGVHHVLSLDGIVDRSRAAHLLAMRALNVSLAYDADLAIDLAHGAECEYILDTLVDNAIRNSPERGTVRVIADVLGERIEVSVVDEGPGVAEALIDRIFERKPGPGPAAAGQAQGTGLGLHLAKKQAEWIGGTLRYELAHPRGAKFTLSVPAILQDEARTT